MKKYRVITQPLFLKEAVLALTKAQAAARKTSLSPITRNEYAVTREVCFKRGEVIGIQERYARSLLKIGFIEPEDKAEAEAEEKAKLKAEEKAKEEKKAAAEAKAEADGESAEKEGEKEGVLSKLFGKDKDKGKDDDAENSDDK